MLGRELYNGYAVVKRHNHTVYRMNESIGLYTIDENKYYCLAAEKEASVRSSNGLVYWESLQSLWSIIS